MKFYFPRNYQAAKKAWRDLSLPGAPEVGRWEVPSRTDTDLEVHHAYWPALQKKERLIIIVSGVHGPESYAGHAIQMRFLNEVFPRFDRTSTSLFMVHGLNPFGFKYNRRYTENGVNLNRNCSASDNLYKIRNPESIALSSRFIPKAPVHEETSPLIKVLRQEGELIYFDDVHIDQFIKTVACGQFESHEGLEFGGYRAEPQIAAWTERLREIMPGHKDILLFDLHTGLGHRGRLHLLTGDPKICVNQSLFHELLRPEDDQAVYEYTDHEEEGFYPTFGATNDLIAELSSPDQRVLALTMEYGTLGHDTPAQLKGLNLWMLEHQGGLYGYANDELKNKIFSGHIEKSNPSDPLWQNAVLNSSYELFLRVLKRAGALLTP